ncbi:hypothetical protein D3C78_1141660 [compost metagenome]
MRRRHRVVRRYQRAVAYLCRAHANPGRPQPGDDRSGRRQPGRRTVPGFSHQQQLLAHAGGRGGWLQDPADRGGRRPGGGGAAAGRSRSPALPAQQRAGRGGDRRSHRPVRVHRPEAHLPHPALGVLAVDGLLCRGRRLRRHPRHRPGGGYRRDRVPVGWLAPALRHSRSRRRRAWLSRCEALSASPPGARPGAVPLGRAAVLRQCRAVPGVPAGGHRGVADAGTPGDGGGRAGYKHRRHLRRHARRAVQNPARARYRAAFRGDEGPGQGQVQALRTAGSVRRKHLPAHRGRRRG